MEIETLIAITISVVSPVLSWVMTSRIFEAKTTEWRQSVTERLERIERCQPSLDLAKFEAMDRRREMDWASWRSDIEVRLGAHIKAQADWRHNEYAPEARNQSRAIAGMQETIGGIKERCDRLERRVFNGHGNDEFDKRR